ncbi:YebC/PmpR family DNA-binding transcriptional regulator [Cohnella pontilimi]|nr:YebC/PmpR family DNA-binding transcriptional regulator [Cohnella pontilimi]
MPNVEYEEILYEGFGPGGVAVMVKCLTDNRDSTTANIHAIFNKYGGTLGESGSAGPLFVQKGLLVIAREHRQPGEDAVVMHALDAGAEDVVVNDGSFQVLTAPSTCETVKAELEELNYSFERAEVRWLPQNTVVVEGQYADKLLKMLDALDNDDLVQAVYHNFHIHDEVVARLG